MKTTILLVAIAFAACNSVHSNANSQANTPATPSPSTVAHQTSDPVRRVTTSELAEMMKQGNVVVVDVRTKDAYDVAHIRGAKLIPVNEVGERAKELPKDQMIVTYCS